MSLIRKHGAVLQAWACLALVLISDLNLAVELQLVKVMFKLFHGLIASWVKSVCADQHDYRPNIVRQL